MKLFNIVAGVAILCVAVLFILYSRASLDAVERFKRTQAARDARWKKEEEKPLEEIEHEKDINNT